MPSDTVPMPAVLELTFCLQSTAVSGDPSHSQLVPTKRFSLDTDLSWPLNFFPSAVCSPQLTHNLQSPGVGPFAIHTHLPASPSC